MDLIEWFIKQKMEEILRKSLETDSVEEAIRLLITPLENNSTLVMKLLNSRRRDETLKLLTKFNRELSHLYRW